MLTQHDVLWGIAFPAILALVAMLIGRFAQRSPRDAAPWAAPLALAGGFIVALIGITGNAHLRPHVAQEWLAWAGVASVAVSIFGTIKPRARFIAWVLSIAVLAATVWLVAGRRQHAMGHDAFYTLLAIAGGAGVVWWIAIEALAVRVRGGTMPLLLSGVAGASALVLANSGTMQLGQIEGGVAIVLLVLALLGMWLKQVSLAGGGVLAAAVIVLGLLLCGYLYAEVKWIDMALLAIAPLFAWAGELPGVRSRPPWQRFFVRFVLVLIVVSIAAVPAAKGLRETLKREAESVEY